MTGAGRPLDWTEIESYLIDVGAELERRGLVRTIIMVGGAYVAYRGVRASTTDVDTIYELDDDLRAAIADRLDLTCALAALQPNVADSTRHFPAGKCDRTPPHQPSRRPGAMGS
ncbi:MAG: hypothetical protein FD127_3867 [Acidimicrobiaceae bacterium]|nr:MAG: hypothetical protein FD127_3867 [Acidimicrobiaceae bacterium]